MKKGSLAMVLSASFVALNALSYNKSTDKAYTVADFNAGTDGFFAGGGENAKVSFSAATDHPDVISGGNSLAVTFNNLGSGEFVNIKKTFSDLQRVKAVRFWLKTPSPTSTLKLLVSDFNGQIHRQVVPILNTTDWQSICVRDLDGTEAHWGGPADGYHREYTASIILQFFGAINGNAYIDDIEFIKTTAGFNEQMVWYFSQSKADQYNARLALLKQVDAGIIRVSCDWSRMEPTQGFWDTEYINYLHDTLDFCAENNIEVIIGPRWIPDWARKAGHTTKNSMYASAYENDFRNFIQKAMDEFGDKSRIIQFWNEPNFFDGSHYYFEGTEAEFVDMASNAYDVIHAWGGDNQMCIAFAGMQNDETWDWIDTACGQGLAGCMDIIDYHSYGDFYARYACLSSILAAHQIDDLPIIITETGFSSSLDPQLEPEKCMALFRTAEYHLNLLDNVEMILYYVATQKPDLITDAVQLGYGLVAPYEDDFVPYPSYFSAQDPVKAVTDFDQIALADFDSKKFLTIYDVGIVDGYSSWAGEIANHELKITGGKQAAFQVNDNWLFEDNNGLDSTVDIEIEYRDEPAGSFKLSHVDRDGYWQTTTITKSGSHEYKKATVTLSKVWFANASPAWMNSDFKVVAVDTDTHIREIAVVKKGYRLMLDEAGSDSELLQIIPGRMLMALVSTSLSDAKYCPIVSYAGEECRKVASGKRLSIGIDNELIAPTAPATDLNLILEYYDMGSASGSFFSIDYWSGSATVAAKVYHDATTAGWRTKTVTIANAVCADQLWGRDLKIYPKNNEDLYMRSIEIVK